MKLKNEIEKLKDGECWIYPESDYGKAQVWSKNNMLFLFNIPQFGGEPIFYDYYSKRRIDDLLDDIESWG